LQSNVDWLSLPSTSRLESSAAGKLRFSCLLFLVCISLLASQPARGQDGLIPADSAVRGESSSAANATAPAEPFALGAAFAVPATPALTARDGAAPAANGQVRQVTQEGPKNKPEQEIIIEGLVSYGNYKIFASGYDEKLFTAGVEYDRHSWGTFLKAQVDYVAEILPFVLLDKPLSTDIWGNPVPKNQKNIREYVPGVGISPIGFRLQWRSRKAIRPYLEAKGGMVGFTKKVPSAEATYESFSLQSGTGVQLKLSERWGLRLGLFGDFHFSNGFVVPVDPGLDVMNANLGVSYHF
jgi:hypothetical protein